MKRGPTGRYHVTTTAGETVHAFVPAPLPPAPLLSLSGPQQRLHERALLACGRLDGLSLQLPEPALFLYAYVRREAVLSSQIEGTQSTLSQLLLFELGEAPGVPFDDVVEVSNYVAAMEHGLTRLAEGLPLSKRLIREVHAVLLSRGRGADAAPGEFRRSQNWLGGTRPGNATFVPPPPHEVEACLDALERFIHDDETLPLLLKAALVHVQFETIHPFLDGNGRLGRLLIALMLHAGDLLRQPLLYLSLYFKQHRAEYYRLLDDVRQTGDWEAWVAYFLEGVAVTAEGAVETAQRLLTLFRNDGARLKAQGAPLGVIQVYDALRARPVATLKDLAARAGVSYPTASKAVDVLTALSITRELTGQRRNRFFAYDAYVALLNEGTEPL